MYFRAVFNYTHKRTLKYKIALISLASLECDFEDFDSCNWQNVDTDDHDWTTRSGSTPSKSTGPSGDFSETGKDIVFSPLEVAASRLSCAEVGN